MAPGVEGSGDVVVIVTAAGSGSRLGSGQPKALVSVAGQPMLRRALNSIPPATTHLIITAPETHLDNIRAIADDAGPDHVRTSVVAGGVTRQDSVAAGLAAAQDVGDDAVILVHDAARALTPVEVFDRVINAVRAGHHAVVPALRVTDTVKQVATTPLDRGVESVVATVDRHYLWAVQTPQGFNAGTLRRAHEAGAAWLRSGEASTDDAGLVERLGERVVIVTGDPRSAKITVPRDLLFAEFEVSQS